MTLLGLTDKRPQKKVAPINNNRPRVLLIRINIAVLRYHTGHRAIELTYQLPLTRKKKD